MMMMMMILSRHLIEIQIIQLFAKFESLLSVKRALKSKGYKETLSENLILYDRAFRSKFKTVLNTNTYKYNECSRKIIIDETTDQTTQTYVTSY